jgi:hypothetical protein
MDRIRSQVVSHFVRPCEKGGPRRGEAGEAQTRTDVERCVCSFAVLTQPLASSVVVLQLPLSKRETSQCR